MKIKLPGQKSNNPDNQNPKSNNPKPTPKKSKSKDNNPKKISWIEKDGFVTSIINYKLIKIDLESFDIHLPNNFKMSNNSSLEEAKEKAVSLLS